MVKGLIKKSLVLILIFLFLLTNTFPLTLSISIKKQEFIEKEDNPKEILQINNRVRARVWLRGWLWDCENKGEFMTAYAIKLHYIEFNISKTNLGFIEGQQIEFSNEKIFGKIFDFGPLNRLTFIFALYKGDLIVESEKKIK